MSVQPDPTLNSICTEGWYKTGIFPSSAEIGRAKTEFLQEIFNDIWMRTVKTGNTRLKTLQATSYFNTVAGQNYIDYAEDMDEELTLTLLNGAIRGTAQAGAPLSITLAADDPMSALRAIGRPVFLTGGIGAGQLRMITSFDSVTKVAGVDRAWAISPDVTTTYLIVENTLRLDEENQEEFEEWIPQQAGTPAYFSKYGQQFIFEKPFDKSTYGIQLRYFKHLMQVDMVEGPGTMISRILRNWQTVLKEGIAWKVMQAQNDQQQIATMQKYEQMVGFLLAKEIAYGGEFTGFTL